MAETLKVFIPMAGWGTRMRPHTWSKPKPLVSVAGKTSLDHLMGMFASLPEPANVEFIFIVGPCMGEEQIPAYVEVHYPGIRAHYVVQREMKGQSHALWLSREYMHGPMIMCFSDSVIETDFGFLAHEPADGVAWVMPVPDPRRFGVAELGPDGWVRRFIEKPQALDNKLVVVGCYYFKNAERLLEAIEEQMRRGAMLKNEYFLTDAITIMLEAGAKVRTESARSWLDTGTVQATLDTNRILLARSNPLPISERPGVTTIPPVYIDPSAKIEDSTIGPYASIGADCQVSGSLVEDSILEEGAQVSHAALKRSLIGRRASVAGRGLEQTLSLNIGDDSQVVC